MLRVCIDVDGVCADMMPVWIDLYNQAYNDNLRLEDITEWNIDKFVKPECGKKIYDFLRDPRLYANTKPFEGFREGILEFKRRGWDVLYVTATVPGASDAKVEWLYRHAPGFSMNELMICKRKYLVMGDVLIDDGAHNLEEASMRTIRFITPYNRGVAANAHTDTWAGMADKVIEAMNTDRYVMEVAHVI